MCRYNSVNQSGKQKSQSSSHGICYCVSFTESKVVVKYVSTVNQQLSRYMFYESNRMFGTKHSEISRLQTTIKNQTNEQNIKYLK